MGHIFAEPEEFTVENLNEVAEEIDAYMLAFIEKYTSLSVEELTEKRYQRFRNM